MFHKMPFILLAIIIATALAGQWIPIEIKQYLYALSLSIKSIILFLLPLVIFSLLFRAAVNLTHQATSLILIILFCVCCSNFMATFLSHYVGSLIYQFDFSVPLPQTADNLQAAWSWELPKYIANSTAMFGGIGAGILLGMLRPPIARHIASRLEGFVSRVLRLFIYLIPLFVAGYIIKLQADGVFSLVIKDYALIFIIIALAQFSYISLLYLIASGGQFSVWMQSLKNMLPAAISGFSTMSSAASMPLTIIGVENNTTNKALAKSVVPATVNIHLIGDCFAIPIFAYAVIQSYGLPEPTLWTYLIFTMYFVIAKFSVAAVPGGGIMVMLPVLESYLGFNSGMMSLITALYILFDPVITCANVLGNGAFAKLIDKMTGKRYEKINIDNREFAKA